MGPELLLFGFAHVTLDLSSLKTSARPSRLGRGTGPSTEKGKGTRGHWPEA